MIVGTDNIKAWFLKSRYPYFRIKEGGENSKPCVDFSPEEMADATNGDGLNELDKALNILGGGSYYVEAYPGKEKGDATKRLYTRYEHQKNGATMAGIGAIQPQAPIIDVQAEIDKALAAYQKKLEFEQLQRELLELKQNAKNFDDRWLNVMEKLLPHAQPLIAGITGMLTGGAPAAVGSVKQQQVQHHNNTNEMAEQQAVIQRLNVALGQWQENEPELIILVEKIAKMSRDNKTMYNMARNMLMNQ